MAELFGRRPASPRAGAARCTCSTSRSPLHGRLRHRRRAVAAGDRRRPGHRPHSGLDEVVVCQMGDATTNIGAFHESLNIAALWKLPVIFVIVNNQFGMGTSGREAGSAVPELYKKACAYRHARRAGRRQRRAGRPRRHARGRRARAQGEAAEPPGRRELPPSRATPSSIPTGTAPRTYLSEIRAQDPIAGFAARAAEKAT